ncbi:hypothetical protein B0H66DRAFT_644071 [Apodospora peruviana]|uniref:Fungal N-terminal domain-containing protein n=1 Tax=Apodospora peruviana TaxID=516989 RepID=A0AAE0LZ46_9PEZI|nr:hypothetical protein B0H66DRAFT_644071 [Apodospora peruviana]
MFVAKPNLHSIPPQLYDPKNPSILKIPIRLKLLIPIRICTTPRTQHPWIRYPLSAVLPAGVSLVTVIFETLDTYKNAPREISTIARGVQDTSLVLDQLAEVLSEGREIQTKLLRNSVLSTVREIDKVHEEVWDLIERGESGFGRVKWTFRNKRMRDLTARIEARKSTLQLVCTTLLLALQQRSVAKSQEPTVALLARRRLRRQAKNLVNAAHQSLLDLTVYCRLRFASEPTTSDDRSGQSENRSDGEEEENSERVLATRQDPDAAALFLYNMVFSRTAGRNKNEGSTVPNNSNALVIRSSRGTDIVLAQRPFAAQVVQDLLHDWTELSDREIEDVTEMDSQSEPRHRESYQPKRQHSGHRRQG